MSGVGSGGAGVGGDVLSAVGASVRAGVGARVGFGILAMIVIGYLAFKPGGGEMTGSEARRLVEAGATLVDVRTPEEFAAGHIPGALNIPVDEVERRIAEFGPRDEPVVLYCRSGNRSAHAARMLEASGYGEVYDLGAMSKW